MDPNIWHLFGLNFEDEGANVIHSLVGWLFGRSKIISEEDSLKISLHRAATVDFWQARQS